jgi:hypothetical protein
LFLAFPAVVVVFKGENDATFKKIYITPNSINGSIFVIILLKNQYVITYYFAGAGCCGSYSLVGKYLYPYGSQDQKYPQCSGSDHRYHLAAKGFRTAYFTKRCSYLN